ncbi:MAG: hypothetical protein KI791_09010 [Cyclobacteriaceae bacterium]|nr:hypothetical protein [Cyclobacteriaceae bacterium SS2]
MNYKLTSILFCIFLLTASVRVFSQKLQIIDAILDEPNNTIEIVYDLSGSNQAFSINLYYSNDGGKTFKGPVERVSGDVGVQILPGEAKKIYWNYFYEDEEFTGENLVFNIRATRMDFLGTTKVMGPKAALYSVLVPGLGDYKVRNGKSYWLVTAGTWGLMGSGLIARSGARKDYDNYLNATDVTTANQSFQSAQNKFKTFKTLNTIAIAIWAADVVGVFIKGNKNEKAGLTGKYSLDLNMAVLPGSNIPVAGLKVNF